MKNLIILFTLFMSPMIYAQNNPQPSIDVTGEGIVTVVPDEVTVTVRVENTGDAAQEVKRKNDATVAQVLQAAKDKGVKEKHINTQYIRLNKNYQHNTKTYNYVANQTIVIKVVDLKNYEPLMNALLQSGINRIDGIHFSSSEKNTLLSEARKKAVANAKMKAEEYTSVLDQKVGKALHISEYIKQSPQPSPMLRSAYMEMDSGNAPQQTLAPGEMELQVKVYVTFAIE